MAAPRILILALPEPWPLGLGWGDLKLDGVTYRNVVIDVRRALTRDEHLRYLERAGLDASGLDLLGPSHVYECSIDMEQL